jgi:hypothetical protein
VVALASRGLHLAGQVALCPEAGPIEAGFVLAARFRTCRLLDLPLELGGEDVQPEGSQVVGVADDGAARGPFSLKHLLLVPLKEEGAEVLGELAQLGGHLRELASRGLGQVQPDASDLQEVLLRVEVGLDSLLGGVVQGLPVTDQLHPLLGQLICEVRIAAQTIWNGVLASFPRCGRRLTG